MLAPKGRLAQRTNIIVGSDWNFPQPNVDSTRERAPWRTEHMGATDEHFYTSVPRDRTHVAYRTKGDDADLFGSTLDYFWLSTPAALIAQLEVNLVARRHATQSQEVSDHNP